VSSSRRAVPSNSKYHPEIRIMVGELSQKLMEKQALEQVEKDGLLDTSR
jgi:hypothetical protein